jgi:hypothetical protein
MARVFPYLAMTAFNIKSVVLSESALWRTVDAHNSYKGAIAVAQRNFSFLSRVSPDNLVFRTEMPGRTEAGSVEISRDTWSLVFQAVNSVAIELRLEPGMFR